jgi:hypothetical protein
MNPKLKGRTENTPARLDEQQGEATFLLDECEEQLQRLADQANNFEITSLGETRKWSTCCERIEEWVREAADSEKTYGERLRDLLRDKSAMQEQVKKHWPVFDFQLRLLFRAIRKIYDSVADSLPPPRVQRIGGRIMFGTEALDRDIQHRMAKHRSEILRARHSPFKEFYAWRAEERRRHAHANTAESESKLPAAQSRRGRGPRANMDRHRAIAGTRIRFGDKWREDANLKKIVKLLDRTHVGPPKRRTTSEVPAESWEKLLEISRTSVINAISYSLRMAAPR